MAFEEIRSFKSEKHIATHGDKSKSHKECPKCDNYMYEDPEGYFYCKNCYWADGND